MACRPSVFATLFRVVADAWIRCEKWCTSRATTTLRQSQSSQKSKKETTSREYANMIRVTQLQYEHSIAMGNRRDDHRRRQGSGSDRHHAAQSRWTSRALHVLCRVAPPLAAGAGPSRRTRAPRPGAHSPGRRTRSPTGAWRATHACRGLGVVHQTGAAQPPVDFVQELLQMPLQSAQDTFGRNASL